MATPPNQKEGALKAASIPKHKYLLDTENLMTGSVTVLTAAEMANGDKVVLKHPDPRWLVTSKRAIRNERDVLSQLNHPNIVRLLEYDNQEDILVLERCGNNLAEIVARSGQELPMLQAFHIMRDILSALVEIHRKGLVHCDIHPGNVLLDNDGKVTLIDFDVATRVGSPTPNIAHAKKPPEYAVDAPIAPSYDIFMVGDLMKFIFKGKSLYDPYSSFLDMLVERDPDERPQAENALFGANLAIEMLEDELDRMLNRKRTYYQIYDVWNIVHKRVIAKTNRLKKKKLGEL